MYRIIINIFFGSDVQGNGNLFSLFAVQIAMGILFFFHHNLFIKYPKKLAKKIGKIKEHSILLCQKTLIARSVLLMRKWHVSGSRSKTKSNGSSLAFVGL